MPEKPYPVIEFESQILPDGVIRLPAGVATRVGSGTPVTVRLSREIIDQSLRARSVSEDEIERIAVRQLEERSNVVRFMKSEGSLSSYRAFRRRAGRILGR
jgi:hypothetical protein